MATIPFLLREHHADEASPPSRSAHSNAALRKRRAGRCKSSRAARRALFSLTFRELPEAPASLAEAACDRTE